MSFIEDIQGQNTQIYPIVTIEPPDTLEAGNYWYEDFQRSYFLSTNNVNLNHIHSRYYIDIGSENLPKITNINFKPLLLNLPSLNQSVDFNSRIFRTSNVKLQFSNVLYNGKRLSDELFLNNILNWKVSIQFISPTANKFSTIAGLSDDRYSWSEKSMYEFYSLSFPSIIEEFGIDFQEVLNEESKKMAKMIYQGVIRKISHDDKILNLELEDYSSLQQSVELPKVKLPDAEVISERYRNRYVPMVYGHVDKSPLVFSSSNVQLQMDSEPTRGFVDGWHDVFTIVGGPSVEKHGQPPLYANIDDYWVGITEQVNYAITIESKSVDINDPIELTGIVGDKQYEVDGNYINIKTNNQYYVANTLQGYTIYPINTLDGFEVGDYEHPLQNFALQDQTLMCDNDLSTWADLSLGYFDAPAGFSVAAPGWIMLTLRFYILPSFDHSGLIASYALNNYIFDKTNTTTITHSNDPTELFGMQDSSLKDFKFTVTYPNTNIEGFDHTDQSIKFYPQSIADNGYLYANFMGGVNCPDGTGNEDTNKYVVNVEGKIKNSWAEAYLVPSNIFKNKFYCNMEGRINEYTDHPNNQQLQSQAQVIKNPIDIIYDIVRKELKHDNINEDSYNEALQQHTDWKFGFTVTKKTNAKKLIENIAKSTRCFPRFNSDGSFSFNTLKSKYSVSNYDAETTQLIKEKEILKYSFKKTSVENIFKTINLDYKKDYHEGGYLSNKSLTTDIKIEDLYNINTEEATLNISSDYIREDATATKYIEFLSEYYQSDYLVMNLDLPVSFIHLEVGQLVKFRELFNNVKAYGIDYRFIQEVNKLEGYSVWAYPLFMITKIKKTLNKVSLECVQLHHSNKEMLDISWFSGCEDYYPDEYPNGSNPDGLFYFPEVSIQQATNSYVTEYLLSQLGYTTTLTVPPFNYTQTVGALAINLFETEEGYNNDTDIEFTNLLFNCQSFYVPPAEGIVNSDIIQIGDGYVGGTLPVGVEVYWETAPWLEEGGSYGVPFNLFGYGFGSNGVASANSGFNMYLPITPESLSTGHRFRFVTTGPPGQLVIAGIDTSDIYEQQEFELVVYFNVTSDLKPYIFWNGGNWDFIFESNEANLTESTWSMAEFEHNILVEEEPTQNYFEKYVDSYWVWDWFDSGPNPNREIFYSANDAVDGNIQENIMAGYQYKERALAGETFYHSGTNENTGVAVQWSENQFGLPWFNDYFSLDQPGSYYFSLWAHDSLNQLANPKFWIVNILESQSTNQMSFNLRGDINHDNELSVLDVVNLVQYILGTQDPSVPFYIENADVNDDGAINVVDVVRLVNMILGNVPQEEI